VRSSIQRLGRFLPLALILAFIGIGSYLVRDSGSSSALTWMLIYDPGDFLQASWSEIAGFFKNLMIPIPPVIGLAEIISIKVVGSTLPVTRDAYRLALVGSYAAAIWLAGSSMKRAIAAFLVSVLFLYVTTKIHPGNPANYDIFFPLFFLLFLLALRRASRPGSTLVFPALCGILLSMTELTRPFLIYTMPLLIAAACAALLHGNRTRHLVAFILPVALISGGWHAYLLAAHGQLTFSNNSGYNVARVWPQIPAVTLIDEPNRAPLAEGRWANLNTPEHTENSRRAQQAQLQYWLTHPLGSLLFALGRSAELLAGNTSFGGFVPVSRWFGLYAIVVRLISSLVILCAGAVALDACLHPRRLPSLLAQTDNLTALFLVLCILFLAAGEIREEPRLLLSVLPMLATLPVYRPAGKEPAGGNALLLDTNW